ncbi:MAG: PKD domain-containing protein, partial [Bacteroidia bacterium]|nr:PKD domain-containing protein [Bacteroidia bacterium]
DTIGCIGQPLLFKDLSTLGDTIISQWTWDFGDGLLGSINAPSHAYSYSGQFNIGLTVTDAHGCKSLVSKPKYLRIKPTPKPSFNLDNDYSCQLPGVFSATNTSSGNNAYKWICSDGSSATSNNFKTNISSYGLYTITLQATKDACTAQVSKKVNVQKLSSKFSLDQGTVCEGTEIKFDNTTTPISQSIKYNWDFGDGVTDTAKNPKHTFISVGKYRVKLSVTNGKCTDSIIQTYTVNPVPNVTVNVLDSIGCKAPHSVEFKIVGNDYASSLWKFGDETSEKYFTRGSKISHGYFKNGAFIVNATILNSYGCAQNISLDQRVKIGTQFINVRPNKFYGCLPKDTVYTLEMHTDQPVESINWKFGDTTKQFTGESVHRYFQKPGNFLVHVEVKTYQGCVLIDTAEVSVGNKYVPTFFIKDKDICGTQIVEFENTTHDSIKKIVRFSFDNIDQFNGDTGNTFDIDRKLITTARGGRHVFRMFAHHFGCSTPSEVTDTVYAHGPYLSLSIKSLDCRNSRVLLTPSYSWGNRFELWKDDTIPMPLKGAFTQEWDPNKYVLKGWNDTFKCFGEISPMGPPFFDVQLYTTARKNQDCAPAIVNFTSNVLPKKVKWLINDKDSIFGKNVNFTFKEPGIKNIIAVGIFDSIDCPDTVRMSINIKGVKLRSSVVNVGNCMPYTINLIDSSVGTDVDVHTFMVNDSVIEVSQKVTPFTISSLSSGVTSIKVKHIVSSPDGCSSEKEFEVPYKGPVVDYEIKRFTICDTPVFYFKAFIDSTHSSLPLSFHWKTDRGFESTAQNANKKFTEMGMHFLTLTVSDNNGCKTIYSDSFEVSPNMLSPQFNANPTGRFCPPLECSFLDKSKTFVSDIVSWEWDFGDGTGSNLKNPKKLYLIPGSYDITLKVTSRSGCTATIKKPAYVIVNGPRGHYDFDRGDACLPHTVEFRGTALDSAAMEWDLGDGVVRQGNYFKHIYNLPGRYIPAMILSDTLGCKYTLPPIDTIEIFAYPEANFTLNGLCLKQPIAVSNNSKSHHENPNLKSTWFLDNKETKLNSDSSIHPKGRGINIIRLIVENIGTCKDTFEKPIRIFAPETDFSIHDKFACLGLPLTLLNSTKSDTGIVKFDWDFGDGEKSIGKDQKHTYTSPGKYNIQLIATDVMGCKDTIYKPEIAVVGDTLEPLPILIRRASVINNSRTELVFESYKGFDFTNYSVYKFKNGQYSLLTNLTNPMDTVVLDNMVNTLDNSYCYKVRMRNLCLYQSEMALTKEHCTMETKAEGLFERNLVKWSPYIGFDSIARYEIWRTESSDRNAYVFLDTVSSKELNYLDTNFTCFVSQHYLIKAIQKGGFKEYSKSDTALATPSTINTTRPNLAWRVTVEDNDYALLEWKNNAWSRHGIRGYLIEKCFSDGRKYNSDIYMDVNSISLSDLKVKVNEQSYVYRMRAVDNCQDTTPWSNYSQTILLKGYFDPISNKPALKWNPYKEWNQGIARYEIDRLRPDGHFEMIASVPYTVYSFIDQSAESSCVPNYIYRVRAISNWQNDYDTLAISVSNHAQVYPQSKLFVPNAFSPDLNTINEKFGPNGQYIVRYKLSIFNRWGEKLYETDDCMGAWDGTYKNERCQQDVYLYHIEALGADNKTYNLEGTFTLLR